MTEIAERSPKSGTSRKYWYLLFFLGPSVLLLGAVYLVPLIDALRYSFTDTRLITGEGSWVGFYNYEQLFRVDFLAVIWRTIIWLVLGVAGSLVIGVIMALVLNKPIRGRALFRVIIVLPWIFPDAIAATMWKFVLHPGWGLLNSALLQMHIIDEPVNFFSTDFALWSVIGVRIWKGAPFIFLTVLAGLQAIPKEISEAALVDGANMWQRLWRVELPLLKPVLWASGTILAAWTLVIFDLVFVLTGGGPNRATEILSITIYNAGFGDGKIGYGSALALAAVVFVAFISYFYVRREAKEGMA